MQLTLYIVFQIFQLTRVNARLDSTFNSLFRSKVIETVNLSKYPKEHFIFLDHALNHFESKSSKTLEKYQKSVMSRNRIGRLSAELENEWKSSVECTLHHSCEPTPDSGPTLKEYDFEAKELKELLKLHQTISESNQISKRSLISESIRELYNLILVKFTQSISRFNNFQLTIFYLVFGPLFNFVSRTTDQIRNSMIEAASTDSSKFLTRTLQKVSNQIQSIEYPIQDQLTSLSGNYVSSTLLKIVSCNEFQEMMNTLELEKFSQRITAGAIQETRKTFPSKKSFLIGSIIFVAVPIIISLVSRLYMISKVNESFSFW